MTTKEDSRAYRELPTPPLCDDDDWPPCLPAEWHFLAIEARMIMRLASFRLRARDDPTKGKRRQDHDATLYAALALMEAFEARCRCENVSENRKMTTTTTMERPLDLDWLLVAAACLWIATKLEGGHAPDPCSSAILDAMHPAAADLLEADLLEAERRVLQMLDWKIARLPNAFHSLHTALFGENAKNGDAARMELAELALWGYCVQVPHVARGLSSEALISQAVSDADMSLRTTPCRSASRTT